MLVLDQHSDPVFHQKRLGVRNRGPDDSHRLVYFQGNRTSEMGTEDIERDQLGWVLVEEISWAI